MSNDNRPKSIFEQMLQGEQVNNEILVGLATDMEVVKQQIQMLLVALYPPTADEIENAEPTALGTATEE